MLRLNREFTECKLYFTGGENVALIYAHFAPWAVFSVLIRHKYCMLQPCALSIISNPMGAAIFIFFRNQQLFTKWKTYVTNRANVPTRSPKSK